jgi:hypothetical protein
VPCCGDWTGRPAKLEIEDDAHISGACSARWRSPVRCEAAENPNGQNVVKLTLAANHVEEDSPSTLGGVRMGMMFVL